jgi:hypothetical protein
MLTHTSQAAGKNLVPEPMRWTLLFVIFLCGCQELPKAQPGYSLAIARMSNLSLLGSARELGEVPANVISLASAYLGDMNNIKELTERGLPKKIHNITITSTHEEYLLKKIAVVVEVANEGRFNIVWWAGIMVVDEKEEAICMDPNSIQKYGLARVFIPSFEWAGQTCVMVG